MFDHCIYFNTMALARRLDREWAKAFLDFDLTPSQAFMLRAILDRPGLMQGELAHAMAISKPTATRALDGLEEKKFIERRVSARDGREQAIHPTAAATAIRVPLNEASAKVTKRLKKLLGDSVFSSTVFQVRKVRTAME